MSIDAYENFDLLITPAPDGYTAHVIASPVGQESVTFHLDFTAAELRNFFWLSGRALRHFHLVPEEEEPPVRTPKVFGERLYAAVFADQVRTQLRRSLDAVASQGKGLRIRLRLTAVPELAELPWEYLYATDLDRALANAAATPVVRYLDLDQPEATMTLRPPLRILGIVSQPSDVPQLDSVADLSSGDCPRAVGSP